MRGPVRRREFLCATGTASLVSIAGCSGVLDGGDDVEDSDGDGVVDSSDYAPRDPAVQEKSDLRAVECECPGTATPTAEPDRGTPTTRTEREPPTTEPTPTDGGPGSVLVDGFESGSHERRWEVTQSQSDASATVVSDRSYRGSRSLRVHIGETGRGDYGLAYDFSRPVQDAQVFSCWCYPTGTNAKLVYDLRGGDSPSENRVTVRLTPFGDVRYSSPGTDGAVGLHDSYGANQWQRLRIELRPSDARAVVGYERAGDGFSVSERVRAPERYGRVRVFAGDYYGNVDVYLDEVAYAPGE